MRLGISAILIGVLSSSALAASEPVWNSNAPIPDSGIANRYQLPSDVYARSIRQGKLHAQVYPVDVTGLLPPFRPFQNALEGPTDNPLTLLARLLLKDIVGLKNVDQFFEWMGLHPYPQEDEQGVYSVPYPNDVRPEYRMGIGLIRTFDGVGFTFSCAACHSSNLFGKTVLGLTNRFPRANETFILAKNGTPLVNAHLLRSFSGATDGEVRMFERVQDHLRFVGAKKPQLLGLDTSLAQVALSMARRGTDDYASRDLPTAAHPRAEKLEKFVADSKPSVWWNLKYKNRWLSDGSIISGNPIYTNLLWNEIGRGADLHELESWFNENPDVIRDLTSAVFSIEAPRITDFFPAERIDLGRAMKGEKIFLDRCAKCHGIYEKAWSLPNSSLRPFADQIKTTRVRYHERTPVIDVGTDPGRYQGMSSLEKALNPLAISRNNGIVIQAQKGYVPPPLVGIWARWPYFHNNSAPSLCAVLTRHEDRPKTYRAVDAQDADRDFDFDCNGYPKRPAGKVKAVYNTSREGMHNSGHDERIFLKNGRELLSPEDKKDLIIFLQTL